VGSEDSAKRYFGLLPSSETVSDAGASGQRVRSKRWALRREPLPGAWVRPVDEAGIDLDTARREAGFRADALLPTRFPLAVVKDVVPQMPGESRSDFAFRPRGGTQRGNQVLRFAAGYAHVETGGTPAYRWDHEALRCRRQEGMLSWASFAECD